jgi:1-phosphatidylinositol-4-phosphate 5-kinase
MGGNESQISPIPPERYGDRFIKFISGMTMSRERAEHVRLSRTLEAATGLILPPGIQPPIDDPVLGGINMRQDNNNPPGTHRVIEKAERSAERSTRRGADEKDVPERMLGALGRDEPDGAVLPVIGEAAESSSQVSRTPPPHPTPKASYENFSRQRKSYPKALPIVGNANMPSESVGEVPPPTPPKPDGAFEEREGRPSWGGGPPPTPPKDDKFRGRLSGESHGRLSVESRDKELPSLPPVVDLKLSASPVRAQRDEMPELRQRFA